MDVWRCDEIASDDGDRFTYTLARVAGAPLPETKTVEGASGQFELGAFYDEFLNQLLDWHN